MSKFLYLILLCLLSLSTFGQDKKFCGNWIGCGAWGISYYQIKKSGEVMWFSNGCTDRGTKHFGTWKNEEDTIILSFEQRQIKYIFKEERLCKYSNDGKHGEAAMGIPKTKQRTIFGVKNKCGKERRKVFNSKILK